MGIADTCEPARTVPLAPWLAFAVNVGSKSGAGADLQQRLSRCLDGCHHQPGGPQLAKIMPASPAPATGLGTRPGNWNLRACEKENLGIRPFRLFRRRPCTSRTSEIALFRCTFCMAQKSTVCRSGDRNRRYPLYHVLACSISPKSNSRPKRVAWHGACGCEL